MKSRFPLDDNENRFLSFQDSTDERQRLHLHQKQDHPALSGAHLHRPEGQWRLVSRRKHLFYLGTFQLYEIWTLCFLCEAAVEEGGGRELNETLHIEFLFILKSLHQTAAVDTSKVL